MSNMTKGIIPLPPHKVRLITNKPEGVGWNDLGKREVWGETIHRQQGTLWGTDSFFRDPTVGALTDFGVDHQTGEIIQWVDPRGRISGWASGRVSQPYGDGKAFLDKYGPTHGGANVVNRYRASMEVSGYFVQPGEPGIVEDSPWSEISKRRVAQWMAHYAHDDGIPWDQFPIRPQDGFSFLAWHQEFTIGTGKVCPGRVVMQATPEVIQLAADLMRAAQEGTIKPPVPMPGLAYPDGMDAAMAADLFGEVVKDGVPYRYSEQGPVSRLWLDVAMTRAKPPVFPRLETVRVVGTRTYWTFANGLTIWRASNREAVLVLGDSISQEAA